MSSKREEERNEKIIRGLMKLPPNRRCINCNSLGPQYVCTNFWTFVCIACSGIHREFTHRVKSVSMSKFTSQEVDALQSGGNQRVRELYLKAWDSQKSRLPDNSNIDKVREFIKKVYVDKLYFQDKSIDRPPRGPQSLSTREDQSRRASSYHSYSQSPPYDFQYEERRYGKQGPSLTRKPGSDKGLYEGKLASFLSPTRFSDHANNEGFTNDGSRARFSDYSVSGGGDPFGSDGLSPNSQRDTGSPFSETSREILNEAPQLPKTLQSSDANNTSSGGKILHQQKAPASGSFGSFDSGSMAFKSVNSVDMPEVDLFSSPFAQQNSSYPPQSTTNTQLPDSLPPPPNVVQDNFDLFGAPFTPQNDTHIPLPCTNTVVHQPSHGPQATPLDFFSGLSQQQSDESFNGGWATFDMMPQDVAMPTSTEKGGPILVSSSDGNVGGSFNPFSVDEGSSCVASSSHEPSALSTLDFGQGSIQNDKAAVNHNQSWSAFDDSAGVQPLHNVIKNENIAFINYSSDADKSIEALTNDANVRTTNEREYPPSSVLPQSSTEAAGVHSFATDHKPVNPFDLPFDSDMESSNTFWNMSSLHAALPNTQAPPSYTVNQIWAFQNSVPSYVPGGVPFDPTSGSLGFMAEQAPSNQVPSINAQGHVASIGGNPFA